MSITIAEAKAWFTGDIVKKEKEMLDQPYDVLPAKSPQRLFARMGKLQKKIIWENARIVNRDGIQYIVIAIIQNQKLRSDGHEMERSFVFYRDKEHKIKMNVIEIMSDKGQSLNGKSDEIITTAFYNYIAIKTEAIDGVNATVFFYDEAYQALKSYKMKDGMWKGAESMVAITQKPSTPTGVTTEVSVCETYYVVQFFYENEVIVNWEILYSYQECYGGGSGDEQLEYPGGSGDGGGGGVIVCSQANVNNALNSVSTTSLNTKESIQTIEETPTSITRNYKWKFAKTQPGIGQGITFYSHETGVQSKGADGWWRWTSFNHSSVSQSGSALFWDAVVNSLTATPVTYNIELGGACKHNCKFSYNAIELGT